MTHGDCMDPGCAPDLVATPTRLAAAPDDEGKRVRRRDLLNLLNFINFREGTIHAVFRQRESGSRMSCQAFPLPCSDQALACRWVPPGPLRLADYDFESLVLSDGRSRVVVNAGVVGIDSEGIELAIPESGYEKSLRAMDRHSCPGIDARVVQAGMALEGRLLDFNADSFRVSVPRSASGSLRWFNPEGAVTAMFSKDGELLYSGECVVKRAGNGEGGRELVLAPNFSSLRRYAPRRFRGQRLSLLPAPVARFEHPFSGRQVCLQAENVSGAGLCVEEFFEHSVLLPGMIIPRLAFEIANSPIFECRAQVLYRNVASGDGGRCIVRCGIVFLDMSPADQVRLSAYIHQSLDGRLKVCGKVDMEELWRFFFESGFIYPSKYKSIESRREEFKRTYEKLYLESPSIARHFLFQDKGQIFGHMSMIRCYPDSWIIHHHAASRSGYGLAGVKVLEEVGRFGNDFYHHRSAHIGYLMCYYRKENRFPSRVFGGVVRDIGDRRGASTDVLAYLQSPPAAGEGSPSFELYAAGPAELAEARRIYASKSGGLMLDALGLSEDADDEADRELTAEFARQGFRRERAAYCLKQGGRLGALIVLTLTDTGLNLSNLTNCAHVVVLDDALDPSSLFAGLEAALRRHAAPDVPALFFPASYLDDRGIAYEKRYLLWVLDMDRADAYFASIGNTFGKPAGGEDHEQD